MEKVLATSGKPIQVGPKVFVVVPDPTLKLKKVVVKAPGGNLPYHLDDLPMQFALALVGDWKGIKDDQRMHLLKGAYAFAGVRRDKKHEKISKDHWDDAGPEGQDLLPVLKDTHEFDKDVPPPGRE